VCACGCLRGSVFVRNSRVLQCVAVCCGMLQRIAACCGVMQCVAALQCVAMRCNVWLHSVCKAPSVCEESLIKSAI